MKSIFIITIAFTLLVGCVSGTAGKRVGSRQWPFPIQGQLADADTTQIVAMIRNIPGIDHRIHEINVKRAHEVEVRTGKAYGPLAGGGNLAIVRKRWGKWRVIGDPREAIWVL